ncbi:MAG: dipeptidase PepV [Synergistaceae bacterium]|nr:dipeptidase PepV [Synergistaceae bacterium]
MLSRNIDAVKDDLLAALQESLRIPSVGGDPEEGAPYGAGPRKALDWTLAFAERMGFRTKNVDNVAGWAELGEGDEMIAVLGHLDVVPEGKGWSVDPWGGELKDGMLYGRGVLDNKGPVLVALFAAKAVFDSKIPLKRRVRVIFGTNEERGSKCMAHYVEAGEELPVAGFTPDAEYPIINAEKGILTYTLSMPFAPSGDFRVLSLEGGVADNVVMAEVKTEVTVPSGAGCRERILSLADSWKGPEGSSLEVLESQDGETMTFVVKGRPAHGSTPELGVNALACLADFMVSLKLKEEQGEFFKAFAELVGFETDGSSLGIRMSDEVSGNLTLCSGVVGMEDDRARFSINIRYPVTKDAEEVTRPLHKALGERGISVEKAEAAAPLYMPEDSPLIVALQKAYKEVTGEEAGLIAIGGGTYAKTMPNVVAFGPVFPGQDYKIHEEDECWSVDDIMKNAHIMARAIVELAGE